MAESTGSIYAMALAKANEIEAELKVLRRWNNQPLSPEKFKNMGAFGSNSMAFEQWLQFVLIPRIHSIVESQEEFPQGSMLGPYAIRIFDGDIEASRLHNLLYELDEVVNQQDGDTATPIQQNPPAYREPPPGDTVSLNDHTIPPVVYTLMDCLPRFEGDALESQLQTFDTFLAILSPSVREEFAKRLMQAADKHTDLASKLRIRNASDSILKGRRAAEPYDHEKAMQKYISGLKKGDS
jgi:uncharacterized protein YqcC (DUF446 family)